MLDSVNPQTAAPQAPLSMEFSRQECWSELPFPPLGDRPDPGIKPVSLYHLHLQADSLPLNLGKPILKGQEELNRTPMWCTNSNSIPVCTPIRSGCTHKCIQRCLHTQIHTSVIQSSWKVQTARVSIGTWMDRIWRMHSMARYSATEREETSHSLDVPWKHNAKWSKPGTKGQTLYDSTSMTYE